jgi:hypothetical protein
MVHAGIIDEDVEPPEALHDPRQSRGNRRLIADIQGEHSVGVAKLAADGRILRGIPARDSHPRPSALEAERNSAAQAPVSTGNQGYTIAKREQVFSHGVLQWRLRGDSLKHGWNENHTCADRVDIHTACWNRTQYTQLRKGRQDGIPSADAPPRKMVAPAPAAHRAKASTRQVLPLPKPKPTVEST